MSDNYVNPALVVDSLAITANNEGEVFYATHSRDNEPFKNHEALPGVFVGETESIQDAHNRALEKIGYHNHHGQHYPILSYRDVTDRDPRARVISLPTLTIVKMEENNDVNWRSFNDTITLAFDHNNIVDEAAEYLKNNILSNTSILQELLNPMLTIGRVKKTVESLNVEQNIIDNLTREMKKYYVKTDNKISTGKGRPASIWQIK